jgi:hypothetical protein
MSDHEIVRIPFMDIFLDELEDAFIDQKETAHDFVWGQMRKICSDAKMGRLNKSCTVSFMKDGKPTQDIVKLRGLELEELPSDPGWIAKNMEKDEVKYFEHKVTNKTMEYLRLFSSFALLRHDKFGDAIEKENAKQIEQLRAADKSEAEIDEVKKNHSEALAKFKESRPTCIEECIFNAIYPEVYRHVTANVDKSLDKENEELYPKVETPATTKA